MLVKTGLINLRKFYNKDINGVVGDAFTLLVTWCSLPLEFLENSWNFDIFFHGPGKHLEKNIISLYSWKTPEILWKSFQQFYKQTEKASDSGLFFCILYL